MNRKDRNNKSKHANRKKIKKIVKNHARAAAQPPVAYRGVFMSLSIDWLTCTKSCGVNDLHRLCREISDTFESLGDKRVLRHGYEGVEIADYGTLGWRGNHVKVDLPGMAMQHVRYCLKWSDEEICKWFVDRGFKITRADAALDCSDEALNPLIALRYRMRDNVRCEASVWDFRIGKLPKNTGVFPLKGMGMTTYAGSKFSERRMRIYDKLTELRKKTGELLTDQFGNELQHLTRVELQCRRKFADLLVRDVLQDGLGAIKKIIGGYVSFLDPRDHRKRRRRRVVKWWEKIVGTERRYMRLPQVVSTPDSSMLWISRQAVPTLKMMKEKAPEKWTALNELIAEYEASPTKAKKWDSWAEERLARKRMQQEYEQDERDEFVIREFRKMKRERMAAQEGQVATWVCYETGDDGEPIVTAAFYEWELEFDEAV